MLKMLQMEVAYRNEIYTMFYVAHQFVYDQWISGPSSIWSTSYAGYFNGPLRIKFNIVRPTPLV